MPNVHRLSSYLYIRCLGIAGCLLMATGIASAQATPKHNTEKGDKLVAEYFRLETDALSQDIISPGMDLVGLQRQQASDRQRLAEMLGLEPMPERTPLEAVVEGTESHDGFRVERLHFQPSPGLYVAANFYLPLEVDQPLPTILYVCGHARVEKDGVSFGNKTGYHHHGVWFARNGYACLIIDTVQLGEFRGEHHGTYKLKKWWWNNRGYTPAGIEAWTGIRALDYLETRKEVDASRFGITGRSGGGVYSWWVAALDQRIKVAVPVAGITTLKNHVVDGCVEGHCDCMYMVNTYRWDYPRVAALLAPRPLLISNSDKDGIFPLDGVVELHRQVRDVYEHYGAGDKLGLQITEGPHRDTQELRVHAFRWFNRFLKDDDALIRSPAEKCIEPNELRVFDPIPTDQRVTTVDEWFVPAVDKSSDSWLETLEEKTFGGWPSEGDTLPLSVNRTAEAVKRSVRCEVYEFDSQRPFRLPLFVFRSAEREQVSDHVTVEILTQKRWNEVVGGLAAIVPTAVPEAEPSAEAFAAIAERLERSPGQTIVYFAPRGVGTTEWSTDEKKRTHIRRRFMLLGQTADSMRIWDVRRAIASVREIALLKKAPLRLSAADNAAAWTLFASLFDQPVSQLNLRNLPKSNREGITLLNVSRVVEMPWVTKFAATRATMVNANLSD